MLNIQHIFEEAVMVLKRSLAAVIAGILACFTIDASASLISRGSGLVYDDELNVTWVADFDYLGSISASNPNTLDGLINKVPYVFVANGGYDRYNQPSSSPASSYQLTIDDFIIRNGDSSLMTWYAAQALASQIHYGGVSGWRVAGNFYGKNGVYSNELQHLFKDELGLTGGQLVNADLLDKFENSSIPSSRVFWMSDYFEGGSNGLGWLATSDFGGASTSINRIGAMFVHDGDIAAIPEPATIVSFLSGLLILMIQVRSRNRSRCVARWPERRARGVGD